MQAVCIIRIRRVCRHNVRFAHHHLGRVVVVPVHDRLRVGKAPVDQWIVFRRLGRKSVGKALSVAESTATGVGRWPAVPRHWRAGFDHGRLRRGIRKESCAWGHIVRCSAGLHNGKESILASKQAMQLRVTEAPRGFGVGCPQTDKITERGVYRVASRVVAIGCQLRRGCSAGRITALRDAGACHVIVALRGV